MQSLLKKWVTSKDNIVPERFKAGNACHTKLHLTWLPMMCECSKLSDEVMKKSMSPQVSGKFYGIETLVFHAKDPLIHLVFQRAQPHNLDCSFVFRNWKKIISLYNNCSEKKPPLQSFHWNKQRWPVHKESNIIFLSSFLEQLSNARWFVEILELT